LFHNSENIKLLLGEGTAWLIELLVAFPISWQCADALANLIQRLTLRIATDNMIVSLSLMGAALIMFPLVGTQAFAAVVVVWDLVSRQDVEIALKSRCT
jgi:uncharacterized protein YheU (UPF0270 family)